MIQEMDLMEIFYWFHRHPELSYEEYDTTAQIKKLLKAADVKILPIPMETGLIAEVKGEKDGPLQALRCDLHGIIFRRHIRFIGSLMFLIYDNRTQIRKRSEYAQTSPDEDFCPAVSHP